MTLTKADCGIPSLLLTLIAAAAAPALAAPGSPGERVRQLLLEKKQLLTQQLTLTQDRWENGVVGAEELIKARVAILQVDLAMCDTNANRVEIHGRIVASLKELAAWAAKSEDWSAILNARLAVLDAEIDLEKAKAAADGQKPER